MSQVVMSTVMVQMMVAALRRKIIANHGEDVRVYGVPRGGAPVALALGLSIVDNPEDADIFVDDLIDSGATMEKLCDEYPGKPFYPLIDKRDELGWAGVWVVFPWEGTGEAGIEDNIRRVIQFIGDDSEREGLAETPKRVAKAYGEWFSGYGVDPDSVLKVFEDGAENVDEMVVVKDITFYSHCEHHMAPFFGSVTIAYIPDGKIVGLSKLHRLTQIFARRLQVQERMTTQIADALEKALKPKGLGVLVKARHLCVESRGIQQTKSETVTSAIRGRLKESPEARAEFMLLAK